MTWLFAPFAGHALLGLAIFTTMSGYYELVPAAVMAVFALMLWAVLIWGVARQLRGRSRAVHLGGCVALAVVAVAPFYFSQPRADDVGVTLVLPRNSQ